MRSRREGPLVVMRRPWLIVHGLRARIKIDRDNPKDLELCARLLLTL